ncbi:MAG: class I SAM-dependent methyltransferase [Bacteroidota bacterium]
MEDKSFSVVDNSNVYYHGHYWNDYELVRKHINKRISSSPVMKWYQHFIKTHEGKKFKKALFVNCGNGWVEREIYQAGLFEEAIGVDYLQPLIDEAQKEATALDLPIRYYQLDINAGTFPETGFDLVVNHAGCHHIAYLNKVLKAINEVMTDDGYFINFDYVGAHRNQYPYEQWSEIYSLNESLPAELRQELTFPHLPTMLATDPTEAIHSELIIEYTNRYFEMEEHKRAGGALAYPILTFNKQMQQAIPELQERWIRHILIRDVTYTEKFPASSMFDYFIGKPNKSVLKDDALMKQFADEENARETKASANGGYYYPLTFFQHLTLEMEDLKLKNFHMRSDLHRIYDNPVTAFTGSFKHNIKDFVAKLKQQ